jgi:hypothetical protein
MHMFRRRPARSVSARFPRARGAPRLGRAALTSMLRLRGCTREFVARWLPVSALLEVREALESLERCNVCEILRSSSSALVLKVSTRSQPAACADSGVASHVIARAIGSSLEA